MKLITLLTLALTASSLGLEVKGLELYKTANESFPEAGKEFKAYLGDKVLATKTEGSGDGDCNCAGSP